MAERYPLIMAAVKRREDHEARDLWELGRALMQEADERALGSVAAYIETQGYRGYTEGWLRQVLYTTKKFPPTVRVAGISFKTHAAAGSPEMLQAIIKTAGNRFVSLHYVEQRKPEIEEAWRRRDETHRKAELRQAKAQVAQAFEAERQAQRREREASSDREREAAQRDMADAKVKRKEAEAARQAAKTAPSPSGLPERRQIRNQMVLMQKAVANAKQAKLYSSRTLRMFDGKTPSLDQEEVDAIVESWIAVQQDATAIINLVRKRRNARGHLAAVG